jgi:DNA-binding transcriptional LysR family regulator
MNLSHGIQIFVRVAELRSFTRAAESLRIPRSSATAFVQQLEGSLGTKLLHRTTRTVQLTAEGWRCYARCKKLLVELDELQTMFRSDVRPR